MTQNRQFLVNFKAQLVIFVDHSQIFIYSDFGARPVWLVWLVWLVYDIKETTQTIYLA